MRYHVERRPDADFGGSAIYVVRDAKLREWDDGSVVSVWWDGTRGRCTGCNSLLVAMSASCAHVAAVKRFIARQKS